MSGFVLRPYVRVLFGAVLLLFAVNKFVLRPFILGADSPALARVIVLSLPNALEAIYGVTIVAGLLLLARSRLSPRLDRLPERGVYLVATLLAGTYVLTQEFELQELGGRNVYDPYDVLASLIGLAGMCFVLWRFGLLQRGAR